MTTSYVTSPMTLIALYAFATVVMIALSVFHLMQSQEQRRILVDYVNGTMIGDATNLAPLSPTFSDVVGGYSLEVTSTFEPPVYLSYRISGIHQNHQRYLETMETSSQVMKETTEEGILASCTPSDTTKCECGDTEDCKSKCQNTIDGAVCAVDTSRSESQKTTCTCPALKKQFRPPYPSGFAAGSVFTDTFRIFRKSGNSDWVEQMVEDDKMISEIDRQKFEHLDPEGFKNAPRYDKPSEWREVKNIAYYNMTTLENFPPLRCESIGPEPMEPAYVAMKEEDAITPIRVKVPDCSGWKDPLGAKCNFTLSYRGLDGVSCEDLGNYETRTASGWGTQSPQFINWMKPAALPEFQKQIGVIHDGLEKGDLVRIIYRYGIGSRPRPEITSRSVVLSNSNALVGSNATLSLIYLINAILAALVMLCTIGQTRVLRKSTSATLTWK